MTDVPDALLPCPFCGGKALIGPTLDDKWFAECWADDCCAISLYWQTKAEAITAWNTRADTTQAARLAALEAEVEVGRLRSIGVKTMGLLHSNVHTKSRCDHDEQKLIVEWRAALTDPAP
jgi:hypothetical protein